MAPQNKKENSESRTADAVLDLSAQVQPVTNTETLVSELDKLDNVVPSNSVPVLDEALLAEIEAQERSLTESVQPIKAIESQTVDEQIKEVNQLSYLSFISFLQKFNF